MTAASRLVEWALRFRIEDAPPHVVVAVGRHVLDGVGTAIAARRLGLGGPSWTVANGLGGPPEALPLTGIQSISAPAAALATGTLVHALDFDDTHAEGLVHVTAVNLPAALAVGQQVGASGRAVLESLLVGYEATCRIGAAAPHGFHARGLHATAVCGSLASALVTARLLGLPARQAVDALGIAGSASGGLLEFLGTDADTKTLHPGTASMNGIVAARLAAAGASGPSSVLEGSRGLYAALSDRDADVGSIVADLGERWEAARITIKPYPNCQLMHAALDSLNGALRGRRVASEEVESIVLQLHPDCLPIIWGPRAGKAPPRTVYEAKFDLPWTAAARVVDGVVDVSTYTDEAIGRAEIAALAGRVQFVLGPSATVAAASPSQASIELRDGEKIMGGVPSSSGSPDRPLSEAALLEKFTANCAGAPESGELAARLMTLSSERTLEELLGLAARIAARAAA